MSAQFPENLYHVLGVPPTAGDAEIRRAARAKQREAHPDLGGSTAQFTRVRLAAEVLTHPHSRAEHDAWLGLDVSTGLPGLRRQQRVSRRHAPEPAATRVPYTPPREFSDVPAPHVDVRRFAWYRRDWHPHPEVFPRVDVPAPTWREAATVGPFVLAAVGVVLWQVWVGLGWMWWLSGAALAVLAGVWVVLRGVGRRVNLARWLFRLSIAGFALAAASAFLRAMLLVFAGERAWRFAVCGGILLVAACLAVAAWWGLEPRAQRLARERILVDIATSTAPGLGERVFGQAGAAAKSQRRQVAGRLIGGELDKLLHIPGVRIVHDVRLPDADAGVATLSHAVVAGRRVALIDDRLWPAGAYSLNVQGHLRRDGEPLDAADATAPIDEFPLRLAHFTETFAQAPQVRGWLVVVPDGPGQVRVDNARTWKHVRLATCESLLREVGDWLAAEGEQVDLLLVRDLAALQVPPA